MRKALDFIILILMVAAISSAATRVYMIRTAAPRRNEGRKGRNEEIRF